MTNTAEPVSAYLVPMQGEWSGQPVRISAGAPAVLGRDRTSDIPIDNTSASRHHCELVFDGQHWRLRDIGSKNGTFVHGQRIAETVLNSWDVIQIGTCQFTFFQDLPESHGTDIEDLRDELMSEQTVTSLLRPDQCAYLRAPGSPDIPHERLQHDLSILYEWTSALQELGDPDQIAQGLVQRVAKAVNADYAALVRTDDPGALPVWADEKRTSKPVRVSRTLCRMVQRTGQAILSRNATTDPDLAAAQSVNRMDLYGVICAPLARRNRITAILHVYGIGPRSMFGAPGLQLVTAMAAQAALALSHVSGSVSEGEGSAGLAPAELVGCSSSMEGVRHTISRVGPTDAPVLILGESGTGKELVARALHHQSRRANGPFYAINCAALSQTLLESELFGHEKGAFTGAIQRHTGKLEAAAGGTLFLDEIGDMDVHAQAKLFRILEGHPFERVGGVEHIRADVRVVAATNRDLEQAIADGSFNPALYYRLNVVKVVLAPLRDRREDIPVLAAHFLRVHSRRHGRRIESIHAKALEALCQHDWPGNVRELENALIRAVILCAGCEVCQGDLDLSPCTPTGHPSPSLSLKDMERHCIRSALELAGRNVDRAAQILGISRATLYRRLKAYGLSGPTDQQNAV